MNDSVYETYVDKDLSNLRRVSLVIPTYNRNYYLSRCLWYHAHFPFAEIIVADSSNDIRRAVNRKTITDIQSLFPTKITYLEYDFPSEKYGGEIYRKWGDAVQHVNTEYSLSCTDKEFLIPTTVSESVIFLDEHPDYSIADGMYYQLRSKRHIVPWQTDKSITAGNVDDRLNEIIETLKPVGTQFALQRTKNYKQTFTNVENYNLYDIRIGETAIELYPVILGKTYRNQHSAMSIRDVINFTKKSGFNLSVRERESSFHRYPKWYEYPKDYQSTMLKRFESMYEQCVDESNKERGDYILKLMIQRYGSENTHSKLLNKSDLLWKIWNSFTPYRIKCLLSHYIGNGIVEYPLSRREISQEMEMIVNIIIKTQPFYENDQPIRYDKGMMK